MADPIDPPIAPVTDRRVPPLGALPRRQMALWGMGLIAIVIVLFALTAPTEKARASVVRPNAESAAPLDAKGLLAKGQNYEEQRRQAQERAAERPVQFPPQAGLREPSRPVGYGGSASSGSGQSQPDPIAAERAKREYESLFASNVVVSRRPGSQQPQGGRTDNMRGQVAPESSSLQDIADAVVKASQRGTPTSPLPPGALPRQVAVAPQGLGEPSTRTERTPPIDPNGPVHRLLEGTIIDGVLTNRLDGSSKAPVSVLVTNPIYSHAGDVVVIPAGSRVLGEAAPVQNFGESRIGVGFHRLIFPDGSTVSLDHFKGLNQAGDNGLKDQVNNHFGSTFAAAMVTGLVTGAGQAVGTLGLGGSGSNRTTVIASGMGNSGSQATNQVMNRLGNRLPTVTIREGSRVRIYLTSDLELKAYGHDR